MRIDESADGLAPSVASAGPEDATPGPAEAPLAPSEPLIRLKGLTYTYPGEPKPVFQDISLDIWPGELVLILGPSGCGKSTLLQVLNGTIPHSLGGKLEGEAWSCGLDVHTTKVPTFSTEIGMVYQDPDAQIVNTRVGDEVSFGLENLKRPVPEILARQKEALDLVGLPHAADLSVFDLSGGQKQRVAAAAALAAQPRLLVLDEPTANLDPEGMREVFEVLERLNRVHGMTIVLVEHRVDELADKISRVVMMADGRITFDGPPRQAFAQDRHAGNRAGGIVGAWFPQVAELAKAMGEASGTPIEPGRFPLDVPEALGLAESYVRRRAPAPAVASPPAGPAPEPGERTLVTIRDLRFAYGRSGPAILDGVSLDLGTAEMVALLGRNGSGKSTLARALMGINPPPKGAIMIEGADAATLDASKLAARVGYVFQNPDHQFVTDRVLDEVAYGMKVRGFADDAIEARVGEVLEIVDLARYRERSPFSLSLGERRRLSVATMLVLEPRLLILDEPTIGQDHERAQQLMALMARLRERYQTTILMITHDMRLVAEWADRALVLEGGRLCFDGTPEALFLEDEILSAAGLLAPPIHGLSRTLAQRFPGAVPRPTTDLGQLVGWLTGTTAATAPAGAIGG